LLFFTIAVVCTLIILNFRIVWKFRAYASGIASTYPPSSKPLVPISVIVPCKGNDGRLLENLENLLNQDYPAAEFLLVTALEEDPAQVVFSQLRATHPAMQIKTVVAGISPYGSEKNNNLLKAVAASDSDSEILVFLDADGKSDRFLIRKLVSGLESSSFAGVTGYRWYEPRWHVLPEVLRTVWNGSGYCLLANTDTSFLWGGAMAFRRKTYEQAGFSDIWARAISTDSPLRVRLNSLGLETRFLPNCIVLSSDKDDWFSLFQWVSRQTLMCRIYNKRMFSILFLANVVGNSLGLGLFIWGLTRWFAGSGLAAGLVGFFWIIHFGFAVGLMMAPIQQILKASGIDLKLHKGMLILVSPLASFLQALSVIYCLFVKRVKWAGVSYEIHRQTAKRL